jgi:hypothetical protein
MEISNLLSRIEKSSVFKQFKKDNDHAFFCAGFIILNYKQNLFEYSLDYRDEKNIFTFKIPSDEKAEITFLKEDLLEGRKPLEEVNHSEIKKLKIDIEALKSLVEKELKKNKVTNSLEEIIAVLQNMDGKLVWHLTCMAAAFTIVNIIFDSHSGEVIKFEKRNLMDFVSVKKPEKK